MSDIDFRCDECEKFERKDRFEKKDRYYNDDKKHKKDVVLACGQVCDENVSVLDVHHKIQVASLELDLRHMKEPLVKLDFSSIVKFRDLDEGYLNTANGVSKANVQSSAPVAQNSNYSPFSAANASFTLKLFRLSSCCKKICIGTWDFKRYYNDIAINEPGLFLAATKDSFCFTKCDHPICEDCVVYLVEVHDTTYEENFLTKLVLTQINFNAIAVDKY